MPDLIPFEHHQDPLMLPVQYNGQEYFTSQYFHRQYCVSRQQAGQAGKYRNHKTFLRLLRNIEAYAIYVGKGDIVEIAWPFSRRESPDTTGTDSAPVLHIKQLQPLFRAAGYNPLALLNATAQLALSHHLDDELSKQMSVAANTTVARRLFPVRVGLSLIRCRVVTGRCCPDLHLVTHGDHIRQQLTALAPARMLALGPPRESLDAAGGF